MHYSYRAPGFLRFIKLDFIPVFILNLCGISLASVYLNKCYCPKIDPILESDHVLRKKLFELRRNEMQTISIYKKPSTCPLFTSVVAMCIPKGQFGNLREATLTRLTLKSKRTYSTHIYGTIKNDDDNTRIMIPRACKSDRRT